MDGKRHAKSLGEEIYTILKERIIRWEYLPYQRLTEQSLCEEFNVSRSPVREALKALEENGLIVKESNVGYEVVQPNLKDVFEYYEFRLALELFLVEKLAMDGIDDAVCEKLSRQWRSLHDDSHEINETIALLDESQGVKRQASSVQVPQSSGARSNRANSCPLLRNSARSYQ